jgi:hypothetical protein
MMTKIEALTKLLNYSSCPIAKLYTPNMEVQVNVAKDNGVRVTGEYKRRRWRGWKDPETGKMWKSFRIPWNADTIPDYTDSPLRWDLAEHAEGIGMTGWDWKNRETRWVGYDFDAITNHKEGLTKDILDDLVEKTTKIPWVSLLRSTSGNGYHLYLFFDKPFPTATHNEHSAVARSMLSLLTVETGFNFRTTVDCVGSILWCFHRKSEGTNGLTWIKENTEGFPTSKIPKNWKDHTAVTSRETNKVRKQGNLEALSSLTMELYLNEDHQKILKWFDTSAKMDWWWDTDYQMLVCHTFDLRDCHKQLELKGVFNTNSSGTSEQNCFAFPSKNGSFVVRRHGKGVNEAQTWVSDELGWTKCIFNADPSFEDACIVNGGLEDSKGAFVFDTLDDASEAMGQLNLSLEYPPKIAARQTKLKKKGNKVIIFVTLEQSDPNVLGFLREKKHWIKTLNFREEKEELNIQDALVRHTIASGSDAGWYISINEEWIFQSKANVKSVLISEMAEMSGKEIEVLMGKSILDPYILKNKPFEDEYLGGRLWNKDAAQLGFKPLQGSAETWWDLFTHIGSGLDDVVQKNPWCQEHGVSDGADYLFMWAASMIQRPTDPLPYLFLYGEQKTGKSTLHEALSLLFKNRIGYARADQALKDKNGFNYELAHSVLCVVEEVDLAHDKTANNKIKDWVTGETISIRELYKNTYEIDNSTHWIQVANDPSYCPIFRGDTRIVAWEVFHLTHEIPKPTFMAKLRDEAPAFLYELVNIILPDPEGRLMLPTLKTEEKSSIMSDNLNPLETFMDERGKVALGHSITIEQFRQEFTLWVDMHMPNDNTNWTTRSISLKLPRPAPIVKGLHGSDNLGTIGNFCLDLEAKDKEYKYITFGKRIQKEDL